MRKVDNMKRNETCCFTGHRKLPKEQYAEIEKVLEKRITELIEKGVRYFGAGGALGFDTMAALIVLKLKERYPQVKLILVLPCKNQTEKWQQKDIDVYEYIKSKCDKYVYTSQHYYNGCMLKRNKHLVDNSGYCICYLTNENSGTAFTVNYAKKNNLVIYNIFEEINNYDI